MMTVWSNLQLQEKHLQNFSFNMFTTPPNVTETTMLSVLLLTTANLKQMWHLRALPWVEKLWQVWSLLFSKSKQTCTNVAFAMHLLHICYMWKSVFSSSVASPTHDTKLNCFTNRTRGLAGTDLASFTSESVLGSSSRNLLRDRFCRHSFSVLTSLFWRETSAFCRCRQPTLSSNY